jgi:hypothetical protein
MEDGYSHVLEIVGTESESPQGMIELTRQKAYSNICLSHFRCGALIAFVKSIGVTTAKALLDENAGDVGVPSTATAVKRSIISRQGANRVRVLGSEERAADADAVRIARKATSSPNILHSTLLSNERSSCGSSACIRQNSKHILERVEDGS